MADVAAETNGVTPKEEEPKVESAAEGKKAEEKATETTKVETETKATETEVKTEAKATETEVKTEAKATETAEVKTEAKATETTKVEKEDKGTEAKAEATDTKEEATEKPSKLEAKIIRQVEYYFGDINLARDKFLHGEIKKDDGWVTLDVMTNFNRLKQLSSDTGVIAAALRKSSSGLMQVHEDNSKIRRSPDKPLPEFNKERKDDLKKRTIYAKHIPLTATLDDVEAFFMTYGKLEHVLMRRDPEKKTFKGSVFVVFVDSESADKFLQQENLKFPDSEEPLHKVFKEDYWRVKTEQRKKSRETELKEKEDSQKRKEQAEEDDFKKKMTKGAILVLSGVSKETKRDEIKEQYNKYGTCAWVDMYPETGEARLRFEEENSASKALANAKEDGQEKVKVGETEVEARVLEGEEEEEHWKKMFQDMRARKNKDRGYRGDRGRGDRMGRKRNSRGGHGGGGGGPQRKRARYD